MGNNDIVPGFDQEKPSLPESWGFPIQWQPITTRLELVEGCPDCLLVRLTGIHEAFNASYLASQIYKAIDAGYSSFAIDFKEVQMGDYREVLLIGLLKRTKEKGGKLILVSPPKGLKDYLDLIGLLRFLDIKDTLDEALVTLGSAR